MISEIKRIISERGEVCLSELYSLTGEERGLVDHAVNQLVSKGIITEVDYKMECRGCSMKCSARGERVYRLAEKA